jgi:hypothetical protein
MGVMRFVVPVPERITEETLQQAYLAAIDRTAWPVRVRLDGALLVLERTVSESASLTIPWPVQGHGLLALSTATLIEQPQPYRLVLELARGTISQLRNQLAEWQQIGLVAPEAVTVKMREAIQQFAQAAVTQDDPQSPLVAQAALQTAVDAGQLLATAYAEQMIAARRRNAAKLPALLGADLGTQMLDDASARQFLAAFNAAVVPMSWREVEVSAGDFDWTVTDQQVEWCRSHNVRICAGPLLYLDPRGLPDWVYLWEDDLDNLVASISEFVTAAVNRYRGKVDLWLAGARLNTSEALSLSEEENLRLAAHVLQLVRKIDPATPLIVSLEQPWGEYMGRREVDFAPLHFADALVRAGLELRAIMLEANFGCFRGGSLPRGPLELSRQLDYWSLLGLPLFLSVSVPSAAGDDALAQRHVKLPADSWTLQMQQAWIARNMPLLLAKPTVQGVFWNQLSDAQPHDFPHAGLFDSQRRPKPALRTLAALRQGCLR